MSSDAVSTYTSRTLANTGKHGVTRFNAHDFLATCGSYFRFVLVIMIDKSSSLQLNGDRRFYVAYLHDFDPSRIHPIWQDEKIHIGKSFGNYYPRY